MGDIGEPLKKRELIPQRELEPLTAPVEEPVPAAPVPEREPEKVPA